MFVAGKIVKFAAVLSDAGERISVDPMGGYITSVNEGNVRVCVQAGVYFTVADADVVVV